MPTSKKFNHGGKRKGAGRKPVAYKSKAVLVPLPVLPQVTELIINYRKSNAMKPLTYQVTYDSKTKGVRTIIVKARNANEAIANAKNQRYTGRNFRDPVLQE